MHYWQVTPQDINENWTEELLVLMFRKNLERLERELEANREARGTNSERPQVAHRNLSNDEFFKRHARTENGGIGIKVIKHGPRN